ncbi:DUF2382 domain-containing protein [Nocardioides piscis]|uniref:PRC and DUF2382 domain-containing protein n=1 Tax=Nocardioides piscis TaxID=2714938 RepID=A0A6G7YF81_9ACTN|nr:PRC and DUF2382 domain-containing protein [Nocardioides piscis]QIK75301.1 PRC and DUF2382 domain-containing protein [Nocardioides piscis]
MITTDQTQHLLGSGGNVIDNDGNKIGSIGQVYLDDQTNEPAWVTTKTGLFGGGESFVPLDQAQVEGDDLRVPFDKDKVKDAPRIADADSHLSKDEEATLYEYYGMSSSYGAADRDRDTDVSSTHGAGHDTSGPDTDSAMTRSEEQLNVGTETREAGRARLRKYIVTENVTTTVPVSREEVRLEREPITDGNVGDATSGADLTTEEHEVVLNEERVVVDKETVPVERVRVDKETITDEQQVSEEVRKEQIELDEGSDTAVRDTDQRH